MHALQILNKAVQDCEDYRNVTIHITTGRQPGPGHVVKVLPGHERVLSDRPTGMDLLAYVEVNIDALEAGENYLNVEAERDFWGDADWHLNVATVTPTEQEDKFLSAFISRTDGWTIPKPQCNLLGDCNELKKDGT